MTSLRISIHESKTDSNTTSDACKVIVKLAPKNATRTRWWFRMDSGTKATIGIVNQSVDFNHNSTHVCTPTQHSGAHIAFASQTLLPRGRRFHQQNT